MHLGECLIRHLNSKPVVAVFCAIEEEYCGILRSFPQATLLNEGFDARASVVEGERMRLFLLCPGVGADRTRGCAQRLLEQQKQVHLILSTGIAGILAPELDIGHVVLSHRIWSYRKKEGELRLLENADTSRQLMWETLKRQTAEVTASKNAMTIWNGPLLSSDTPVADASLAESLYQKTGALCVEMEAAGLVPVCREEGIPFLAVKIMSDFADRGAFLSMLRHQKKLCGRLGRLLAGIWNQDGFLC